MLRVEYLRGVNDTFDEQDIVVHVIVFIKNCQLCELRAARRHIHVRGWLMERGGFWRGLERLNNMLSVSLIWKRKRDVLFIIIVVASHMSIIVNSKTRLA